MSAVILSLSKDSRRGLYPLCFDRLPMTYFNLGKAAPMELKFQLWICYKQAIPLESISGFAPEEHPVYRKKQHEMGSVGATLSTSFLLQSFAGFTTQQPFIYFIFYL